MKFTIFRASEKVKPRHLDYGRWLGAAALFMAGNDLIMTAPFYSPGDGEQGSEVLPEQSEDLQLSLSQSCEKSKLID